MKIELNGAEFELDLFDIDKYDNTLAALTNFSGQFSSVDSMVEKCNLVDVVLAELFGEDASQLVFKGKRNLLEYLSVATTLARSLSEQLEANKVRIKQVTDEFEEIKNQLSQNDTAE